MLGAALDPTGTAISTADQSLNSLTQADASQLANSSSSDIDRIIAENPNAANAKELEGLRGDLAQQPGVKGIQQEDFHTEYRTQHDRRLLPKKRLFTDKTVLSPLRRVEDNPTGMADAENGYPHGVDAPREDGPSYVMETQQFRFTR